MNERLSQKDWILISTYLDGHLAGSEIARVDSRLKIDPQFNRALREIRHTRQLLRSLPAKRAPRNFTLSEKYARSTARRWGIPSYFGAASAAAALMCIVLAVGVNWIAPGTQHMDEAPMAAVMSESAMDSAAQTTDESESAPMIITWGQNQANGMGGGGSSSAPGAKQIGGGYGGGAPDVFPQTAPSDLPPTETPLTAAEPVNIDPSSLILGLPKADAAEEMLERNMPESAPSRPALPASTLWMIGLGSFSLVTGLLALILRRR